VYLPGDSEPLMRYILKKMIEFVYLDLLRLPLAATNLHLD